MTKKTSNHEFINHSIELVELMRKQSPRKLSKLMHISPKLAELNVDRYHRWKLPFSPANAKQAVLAFKGDGCGEVEEP